MFLNRLKLTSSCCIRSRTPKYLLRQLDIAQLPGLGVRLNLFLTGGDSVMELSRTCWTLVILDLV